MIEDVEEVGRKPGCKPLSDVEVFVESNIGIPQAGTAVKTLGIGIEKVCDRGVENAAVGQLHRNPIVKSGSQRTNDSGCGIRRNERLQITPRDIGSRGRIEITTEP